MQEKLIIVGAGGLGRVVFDFLMSQGHSVSHFYDDNPGYKDKEIFGIPVVDFEKAQNMDTKSSLFFLAVLDPGDRNSIVIKLRTTGIPFYSYNSPTAFISPHTSIGVGCTVLEHAYIMNNACLDDFVHVHYHSAIGHDATVGSFSTFGPNCIVGGHAIIGKCVKVGMSARILPKVNIGDYATIGAGSVVTKSIKEGEVWAGVPARKLRG